MERAFMPQYKPGADPRKNFTAQSCGSSGVRIMKRKLNELPAQVAFCGHAASSGVAAPPPYIDTIPEGPGEPCPTTIASAIALDIKHEDRVGVWNTYSSENRISSAGACTAFAGASLATSLDVKDMVKDGGLKDLDASPYVNTNSALHQDLWQCGEHEGSPFSDSEEDFVPFLRALRE
jgi:hypothetical protein